MNYAKRASIASGKFHLYSMLYLLKLNNVSANFELHELFSSLCCYVAAFVEHPTQIERKQQHCSKLNNKNLRLTMVAHLQQQLVVLASSRCALNFNYHYYYYLITVRERVRGTDRKLGHSVCCVNSKSAV